MAEYFKTFEGVESKVDKFHSLRRVEDRVEVVRGAVMSHQEYRCRPIQHKLRRSPILSTGTLAAASPLAA